MKNLVLLGAGLVLGLSAAAQIQFDPTITTDYSATQVMMPASPLKMQRLFIGGVHYVQTGVNDSALAKEWHDFIGFVPETDPTSQDLGWVAVNHEMIEANDKIGDGGGMTVFKVRRDPATDTLIVVRQTLNDGRTGKYFNVDFTGVVGETGMNCGGINGLDGRIWTAEEWFRTSNASIYSSGAGVRDTADWTISTDVAGNFNGQTVKKYQNFNYMVEIDAKQARAIRKQYNWGRQGFEGGAIMPDNKTVYLGVDNTPAMWLKFVANTAGDFTSGNLFAWKPDGTWAQLNNSNLDSIFAMDNKGLGKGAAMFNRIEWVTEVNGKVYFTETGRDNLGSTFINGAAKGGTIDDHWVDAARRRHPNLVNETADSVRKFVEKGLFNDYYGRVNVYDPATGQVSIFLEGGPYLPVGDPQSYPNNHLSNPDGLSKIKVGNTDYLVIQEDLNGLSMGRVPVGTASAICELFLLDLTIANPTLNDLQRITFTPLGAEITGAVGTPDGKTLLVNSQHPAGSHPFPDNHSHTYAITGFDKNTIGLGDAPEFTGNGFQIYPNPATRELHFNKKTDVAIYDMNGKRLRVYRDVETVNVFDLAAGTYFVRNAEGETQKLIIQK